MTHSMRSEENFLKDGYDGYILDYIVAFMRLDERRIIPGEPTAWGLVGGEFDEYGYKKWQSLSLHAPRSNLEKLYEQLPVRSPPLYEQLILACRWAEADLKEYRLLANPVRVHVDGPWNTFEGLLQQMEKDKGLWDGLVPNGFLPFGKGPDMNYDPVCFDFRHGANPENYRIVQIDHEELLCNYRIVEVAELAPNFKELMARTIKLSQSDKVDG